MTTFARVVPRFPVANLGATIEWYSRVLSFECASAWPNDTPTFAILERGGVSLHFYIPEEPVASGAKETMLSLDVDEALELHASLVAQNVPIEWGPEVYWYGRREFAITDPDGYMLILSEETADAVTDNG